MKKIIKTCIIFSTADWDAAYWTNKQHTALNMAKRGIDVLYVESVGLRAPKLGSGVDIIRILRRFKKSIKGIVRIRDNLWIFSPLVIPFKHNWSFVSSFNKFIIKKSIDRFLKENKFLKEETILWTYHPYISDYIKTQDYMISVYHCVDDLSEVPGIDKMSFKFMETQLLKQIDIVFTTNKLLYEKCKLINSNCYYFPNVVDWDHFSESFNPGIVPKDISSIPKPIIGYIGVLSDFKVDFDLLLKIFTKQPDWHLVLIGTEREGQQNSTLEKLKELNNIHLLGHKDYSELPKYLREFNVGLLPSLINSYTNSMFPMKFYEYLSSGVPVVTSNLGFVKDLPFKITPCLNDDEFIQEIDRLLKSGRLKKDTSYSLVNENTWQIRLNKMFTQIEKMIY